MKKGDLISLTSKGFFCERGGFYIDPWRPVDVAVLTHTHSDHAYRGSKKYIVTDKSEQLARIRLDDDANISTRKYGEKTTVNGVKVSFHPAGHILGSAQVRIEYKGEIWVVSGDYKLTPDPTCEPFEPIKCHNFISEATFGLPIYRWPRPRQVFAEISDWWRRNQERGKSSGHIRLFPRQGTAHSRGYRQLDRPHLHTRSRRAAYSRVSRGGRKAGSNDLRRWRYEQEGIRWLPYRRAAVGADLDVAAAFRKHNRRHSPRAG
jgi:hypothetical protein